MVMPLQPHGGTRQRGSVTTSPGRGRVYWLARLARDNMDLLLDQVERGLLTARAAAIAAGILQVPSALKRAQRAFWRLDEGERAEFLAWLSRRLGADERAAFLAAAADTRDDH
jgi:hypothetical protein